MTPEAQRIAIAEVCGWQDIKENVHVGGSGEASSLAPVGKICNGGVQYVLPDYLNDLNAMHEAEKMIKGTPYWKTYETLLAQIVSGDNGMFHITATQRAEAFLRPLNLWTS